MKKLLVLFSVVFLLISCEDELRPDVTQGDLTIESIDDQIRLKSGSPDQPGDNMKVYRFEESYYWKLFDESNGLTAWVGVDLFALCDGESAFDMHSFQEIVKEEDDDYMRIVQQIKGEDVSVSVWDFDISSPGICSQVSSNEPVFVGTGKLVYTDNDVVPDGQNTNTWGLRLNGNGISIKHHAMFDGEDISTLKEKTTIKLK